MPSAEKKAKTLYDKVLDAHIVNEQEGGTILLYIGVLKCSPCSRCLLTVAVDRHLVHEVTSPVCPSLAFGRDPSQANHRHSKHSKA